jgi:hypothetical protein
MENEPMDRILGIPSTDLDAGAKSKFLLLTRII